MNNSDVDFDDAQALLEFYRAVRAQRVLEYGDKPVPYLDIIKSHFNVKE